MVTGGWRTGIDLIEHLRSCFYRFDIFQLYRLLRIYTFESNYTANDLIKFKADTRFEFQAIEITDLKIPDTRNQALIIKVPSFVLSGSDGPLPESHRELLFRKIQEGDTVLNDFLNIFNHRLNIARCWLKEINSTNLIFGNVSDSRLAQQIRHVTGFHVPVCKLKAPLNNTMLMAFSGMLVGNRRSSTVIVNVLKAQLGLPVRIKQFSGKWVDIQPDERMFIGKNGKNNAVGKTAILGKRVWNTHNAITITIGPVEPEILYTIVPEGEKFSILFTLMRFLVNDNCDCEFCVYVVSQNIPLSKLSSTKEEKAAKQKNVRLMLSRNAWIKSRQWDHNEAKEVRFVMKTGTGVNYAIN
jgi:type VI secretion system protein ImpH